MMQLHTTRDKNEEAFDDMFRDCREHILRVDELHSSPENDAVYVFIIWTTHDMPVFTILKSNIGPQARITRLDENLFAISESVC